MEKQLKKLLKTLKVNENRISTVMGGLVIIFMGVMIFNYFKSVNKGQVTNQAANQSTNQTLESSKNGETPTTYKVKKGDDLWHISENFYKSGYNYVDIAKENKLSNPSSIEVGMELKIPKVEPKKITVKEVVKGNAGTEVKTAKITIDGEKYTTVKGDHLWSIAVRAYGDGYAWTKIYTANKEKIGKNPSMLFSGVELSLPR